MDKVIKMLAGRLGLNENVLCKVGEACDETMLGNIILLHLEKQKRNSIYIPDFINKYCSTRQVPILKSMFEDLIVRDKRFSASRTSLVFVISARALKRTPKVRGYLYSHIQIYK